MGEKVYGLLGRKLGHSWSAPIHAALGCADYRLIELEPEELGAFLAREDIGGLNVTIPYKRDVMAYCDVLDPMAEAIGSVNTLVRRADGKLYGYNTDAAGFCFMAQRAGIGFAGKKTLVLGSGGASLTAQCVLGELGAEVVVVSRSGADNYENVYSHTDAALIVNATPVGMYPKENLAPLHYLPHKTEYVFDAIYNPPVTATMRLANPRKTATRDGLYMLVMQAARAQTIWYGAQFADGACDSILRRMYGQMAVKRLHDKYHKRHIVLCGFMGSGKTTIGRKLARVTGLDFVDADLYLEEKEGMKISDIFAQKGEAYFRDRETAYIRELSQRDGIVLSLGGGAVLRPENVAAVKETGLLIHLDTPFYRILKNLSYSNSRPLLNRPDKQAETRRLYNARKAIYHRVSDTSVRSPKLSEVLDKVVKSV